MIRQIHDEFISNLLTKKSEQKIPFFTLLSKFNSELNQLSDNRNYLLLFKGMTFIGKNDSSENMLLDPLKELTRLQPGQQAGASFFKLKEKTKDKEPVEVYENGSPVGYELQ